MAEQNRTYLVQQFRDGEIPNGADFADMIDSSLNLLDDGLTSYKISDSHGIHKRFGIGDTAPQFPLGITAEVGHDEGLISFTSSDGMHKWNLNLNPTSGNVAGFSIDDSSTGTSLSRLFIDAGMDGKVGIGTVIPEDQLHVSGAVEGDALAIRVENLSTGHFGWNLAHVDDNAIIERSGAFGIIEMDVDTTGLPAPVERMTFLKKLGATPNFYNNVGINETLPFATLHVSRLDVNSDTRLAENTGILLLGPIDSTNLALDSYNIQARTGGYVGPTLSFDATELGLQPLGGDILIHRDYPSNKQVIITDDGLIGIGKIPVERLEVEGAVTFGDTATTSPAEGTVRWHTDPTTMHGDLQVFKDGMWTSLTTHTVTDGFWSEGSASGAIYYEPSTANAKVGIGITTPTAALHVVENDPNFLTPSATINILHSGRTSSSDPSMIRSGIRIATSGAFSTVPSALNVGVYVSSAAGQANANANLGALINGSVVIGTATGLPVVGANGTNVLAIQNGAAPTTAAGSTSNAGIQLFSSILTTTTTSVFNLMNGDGTVIQLFLQPALPTEDMNNPNTGDVNTDLLINNMRDRIDALEARLQGLGLIL